MIEYSTLNIDYFHFTYFYFYFSLYSPCDLSQYYRADISQILLFVMVTIYTRQLITCTFISHNYFYLNTFILFSIFTILFLFDHFCLTIFVFVWTIMQLHEDWILWRNRTSNCRINARCFVYRYILLRPLFWSIVNVMVAHLASFDIAGSVQRPLPAFSSFSSSSDGDPSSMIEGNLCDLNVQIIRVGIFHLIYSNHYLLFLWEMAYSYSFIRHASYELFYYKFIYHIFALAYFYYRTLQILCRAETDILHTNVICNIYLYSLLWNALHETVIERSFLILIFYYGLHSLGQWLILNISIYCSFAILIADKANLMPGHTAHAAKETHMALQYPEFGEIYESPDGVLGVCMAYGLQFMHSAPVRAQLDDIDCDSLSYFVHIDSTMKPPLPFFRWHL